MSFALGFGLRVSPVGIMSPLMRQVRDDTVAYADLLLAHGGSDIRANGEFGPLYTFAAQLYAAAGQRVDFWALGSAQNMGTGSTVYSFHGAGGTLVNGPTWGIAGVHTEGNHQDGSHVNYNIPSIPIPSTLFCAISSGVSGEFNIGNFPGGGEFLGVSADGASVNISGTSGTAFGLSGSPAPSVYGVSVTQSQVSYWDANDYVTESWGPTGNTTLTGSYFGPVGLHSQDSGSGSTHSLAVNLPMVVTSGQKDVVISSWASTIHPDLLLARQARRDTDAYAALLLANGGSDIEANGEYDNILAFSTALYQTAGQRVDFWMFRSTQNMGAGSVAYSFHGASATLVNGPTWETAGIRSTGTGGLAPNILLQGTARTSYSTRSVFLSLKPDASTLDNYIASTENYHLQFGGAGSGFGIGGTDYSIAEFGQSGAYSGATMASAALSQWNRITATFNAGTVSARMNGAAAITATGSPAALTDSNDVRLMAPNGGSTSDRGVNGVISVYLDSTRLLSDSQLDAITGVYASTIGHDLSLP